MNVPQSEVRRLKYAVEGCFNGVWGDEPNGVEDMTVVRVADFDRKTARVALGESPTIRAIPLSARNRRVLARGDLLIEKSGGGEQQPVGNVVLFDSDVDAVCSNFVARLPVVATCHPQFIAYTFQSLYAQARNVPHIKQTSGIQNLDSETYLNEFAWQPRLSEQRRIANFLDEQTARIDALIAEKNVLASTLKVLRSEAIDSMVLGSDLPSRGQLLKGLGILGPIPLGWSPSRMKYELEYVTSGSRGWADFYSENGALFVRIGNLTRDSIELDLDDIQRVELPDATEGVRARVIEGDLLISITAYLGSVAVAPDNIEEAYVSQHVSLARPNRRRALPKWLGYVVLSCVGRTFFELQAYGGTKVQLSLDDIYELPVPLPDRTEQARRIALLEQRLEQVLNLEHHVAQHIQRLSEYRSSLISAAVSGQLDVSTFKAAA